jgi:hypothetical protein
MISTAYLQVKLKDQSNIPRLLSYRGLDPEANLEKISLIHDIEIAYRRSLISECQIWQIEDWLTTGIVEDKYSLSAALAAIAAISKIEDEDYAKNHDGLGKTQQEILRELERLSETFTAALDVPLEITEEVEI